MIYSPFQNRNDYAINQTELNLLLCLKLLLFKCEYYGGAVYKMINFAGFNKVAN